MITGALLVVLGGVLYVASRPSRAEELRRLRWELERDAERAE